MRKLFDLNSGTNACNRAIAAQPKNESQEERERIDYERDRICDARYPRGKNGEAVWLGSEPPHPKRKTPECKKLAREFYSIRRKRSFADTYHFTRMLDSNGKWHDLNQKYKYPSLANKSADILEEAVRQNCFFY